MPTFKRFVMRRDQSILLFTRKPTTVLKNRFYDKVTCKSYPLVFLQENEFDYKKHYSAMEEGRLYEAEINVTIKEI